jgi:NAD(P)-dependent dehydrogenase (short-subunit alcohol dehydrogenase family)
VTPAGKIIVVTGGASGIGEALVRRFARDGAKFIAVADIDLAGATRVAESVGAGAFHTNVADEADIQKLVTTVEAEHGPIELFCSNAGIILEGGAETPDADWERIWDINVKAHIYAARAVLPGMIARGSGYLLQTVSAAGLLSQIGSAPYSVTKHAALAFAEWLAITHYDQGIRVSALCPQGVRTNMLDAAQDGMGALLRESAISPEQVADDVIAGLAEERFLILPHPEVAEYFYRKATDYERWLRGMRRLQTKARDLDTA